MRIASMLRWLLVIAAGLGLFAVTRNVTAETRLPALCSAASTGQGTCTGTTTYDYPSANKLVSVQGTKWYFWSTVQPTALVSVCATDVPRGTKVCPTTALVVKSIIPLSTGTTPVTTPTPEPTGTFDVVLNWQPPTIKTDEGKTSPIVEGDIIGYRINWVAGSKTGEVTTPAGATSQALTLPATRTQIDLRVQGKDMWSDPKTITAEPRLAKPGLPTQVTITFGSP